MSNYVRISDSSKEVLEMFEEFSSTKTKKRNIESILHFIKQLLSIIEQRGEKYIDETRFSWVLNLVSENLNSIPSIPKDNPKAIVANDRTMMREFVRRVLIKNEDSDFVISDIIRNKSLEEQLVELKRIADENKRQEEDLSNLDPPNSDFYSSSVT